MKTSLVVLSLFFTCLGASMLPAAKLITICDENPIKTLFSKVQILQDKIKDAERQIVKLNKDKGGRVAFGASVEKKGNTGPYSFHSPLTFKNIFNSGSFSPSTGIFTAPYEGVYFFSFTGHSRSNKPMGLQLMKNEQLVTLVYNYVAKKRAVPFQTGSSSAILQLKKGDRVYLRLMAKTWVSDDENHRNVFNGVLLYRL